MLETVRGTVRRLYKSRIEPFGGINAISTLSNLTAELSLRTKWHVISHLHVISARCVARDLHTVAPGPLERACWRQFAAL